MTTTVNEDKTMTGIVVFVISLILLDMLKYSYD